MSVVVCRNCTNVVKYGLHNILKYSSASRVQDKSGQLLISCKQKKLNHYASMYYGTLDEVPLASKGWNHSKSKNDEFTVYPLKNELKSPTYSFEEFDLHASLIDVLKSHSITNATEFQSRGIKAIQTGDHALLAAETGCGKTISYLLPVIHSLISNKSKNFNTPKAVVLVPNRELAFQVGDIANILGESVGVNVKIIVGGNTKRIMMNPTFEEIDLLVATPGALGKLSTVGVYRLNEVQHAVLDEADTLIDDSFIERMEGLIKRVPESQIILVSATLPKQLPDILSYIEPNLQHIISAKIHKPLVNITQRFLRLSKSNKPSHLLQIAKNNKKPMLVFTNKNQTCNWLALFLRENGVPCSNINGDMNYAIRIEQWNQFVRGDTKILSATDVGSRGLNTIQVRHVLNYDFPLHASDYLHRIGRVGRLGSPTECKVTNFVSGPAEVKLVQQVEMAIRKDQPLTNVDGNITNIVQNRLEKQMRETA